MTFTKKEIRNMVIGGVGAAALFGVSFYYEGRQQDVYDNNQGVRDLVLEDSLVNDSKVKFTFRGYMESSKPNLEEGLPKSLNSFYGDVLATAENHKNNTEVMTAYADYKSNVNTTLGMRLGAMVSFIFGIIPLYREHDRLWGRASQKPSKSESSEPESSE